MPFAFIFPDKIHVGVGHCCVEDILKIFGSFGNFSFASKTDIDEAIWATVDERFQLLQMTNRIINNRRFKNVVKIARSHLWELF